MIGHLVFLGLYALTATPFKASGIYGTGETAGWTVTSPEGGQYGYTVKKNNGTLLKSGTLDLAGGSGRVEVSLSESGMLFMQLTPASGGKAMDFGAAVAPTGIKGALPAPADFDAFWKGKIKALHTVPENAVLTPGESGREGVDYWTIRMDHVNGTHVYGQMARPSKPGKYPAILQLQWASPPYPLQRSWIVDRAAQGFIVLNIEPHDVLPTEPASYYAGLPEALKNYNSIGQEDREKSYFVEMYLRDYRAADYLTKRPDWDGKTLIALGTSMGGQQSLAVAGLHPRITHVIVNEPAGCDLSGASVGRQVGYPYLASTPAALNVARYVDCVNFASHIKATSLVAMGFTDTIAPPAGIWAAYNAIKGPKEAAPMIDSPHNNLATPEQQRPFTSRSEAWLAALARGEKVMSKAVARSDANSKEAHRQLVAKAKSGGIDLYFVGDSITRRWGTSDPQYRDFLANWKANFFGWNAGNFGWGGDMVENILWRLSNGELDGVQPKVFVVLAGTNNLGSSSSESIVSGVRSIVDLCLARVPSAKVVLTGILPRDGHPEVGAVNSQLALLAGPRVRFLDVSSRLGDSSGKPLEGMTVDGLHLSVKGYQVWADGLRPLLLELLGPPAKVDHAPAPAGDPGLKG